jgi:hypothetical protein
MNTMKCTEHNLFWELDYTSPCIFPFQILQNLEFLFKKNLIHFVNGTLLYF